MPKANISLSPPLVLLQAEAAALGVSFTALLTADVVRYRAMAEAAVPDLDEWQWRVLHELLDGIEQARILGGDDTLPDARRIVAEIDSWADTAGNADTLRAAALRQIVAGWSPLTIAGVLFRLRPKPDPMDELREIVRPK